MTGKESHVPINMVNWTQGGLLSEHSTTRAITCFSSSQIRCFFIASKGPRIGFKGMSRCLKTIACNLRHPCTPKAESVHSLSLYYFPFSLPKIGSCNQPPAKKDVSVVCACTQDWIAHQVDAMVDLAILVVPVWGLNKAQHQSEEMWHMDSMIWHA